jgi:Fic family protein
MSPDDFSPDQQKHLIKTTTGAWAYNPPALPPRLDYSDFTFELVAAAAALGELKGAARRLNNPYMLIGPLVQKEALISSAIEGTITTIENMIVEQATPASAKDENAREASNYVRAVHNAVHQMQKIPISHRLIKDAHKILLSGLSPARGQGKRPGEYKDSQNAIGRRGDTEYTARYVPPPPAQTAIAMDNLEKFINRENANPSEALVDIALVHYQFEAIHPFLDGNGRVGRMLITLMAIQSKVLDLPLLHISAEIEKDKDEYLELLFEVSSHGSWNRWIKFFLGVVRKSCEHATTKVDDILLLEKELKTRAMAVRKNHRLNTIVEALFTKHWITTPETQELCGTHFQTAQADLEQLLKASILKTIPESRPLIYVAHEIWNVSNR